MWRCRWSGACRSSPIRPRGHRRRTRGCRGTGAGRGSRPMRSESALSEARLRMEMEGKSLSVMPRPGTRTTVCGRARAGSQRGVIHSTRPTGSVSGSRVISGRSGWVSVMLPDPSSTCALVAIRVPYLAPRMKLTQGFQPSFSRAAWCATAQTRSQGMVARALRSTVAMSSTPTPLIGCRKMWAMVAMGLFGLLPVLPAGRT